MPILLLLALLLSAPMSWAYPQFIGYNYSSCLTCHYNGNGSGPLNDYGRALWTAEIAGRLWSSNNEEILGANSTFMGMKSLPWWLRPGFKARQLYLISNPNGPDEKSQSITMQAEANAAFFFDKEQKRTLVVSYGYVPNPLKYKNQGNAPESDNWISREHYLRYQISKELWIYAGMMDKPYGIRHVNHTAYSRMKTGNMQNDQVHGVNTFFVREKWELSFMAFLGNLYQRSENQQKGRSLMYEYETRPNSRIGASYLYSSNAHLMNQRLAGHGRFGFGHGSSILAEVGLIEDTPENYQNLLGYYVYSEMMQKLSRGYHFFVTGQAYRDRMDGGRPNNYKGGFGFLMFPMQRMELRVEAENSRQVSSYTNVSQDVWRLMGQLHLAL